MIAQNFGLFSVLGKFIQSLAWIIILTLDFWNKIFHWFLEIISMEMLEITMSVRKLSWVSFKVICEHVFYIDHFSIYIEFHRDKYT